MLKKWRTNNRHHTAGTITQSKS